MYFCFELWFYLYFYVVVDGKILGAIFFFPAAPALDSFEQS